MTKQEVPTDDASATKRSRSITGEVVNTSCDKTGRVIVYWQSKHLTGKGVPRKTAYLIHDEKNELKIGNIVSAREVRPYSKNKRFCLDTIISK